MLASLARSASASVSELSSSRHTAWLNFAGFHSSGVHFFAYRIQLSLKVCDIALSLVLVMAVSCLVFWRFRETISLVLLSMFLSG